MFELYRLFVEDLFFIDFLDFFFHQYFEKVIDFFIGKVMEASQYFEKVIDFFEGGPLETFT